MEHSSTGQVALVTGGTKGIGKAIADKLSHLGYQVVVTARTSPGQNANGHYFIAADLTRPESVETIATAIQEKYGRIDVVVNNAGANLSPGGGFGALSDQHWYNDWQLNFLSVVRMNKVLLPIMIEQKSGTIINISTNAAKMPIWEMTMSYSSAKAALNAYSKALANEVASKGIRVNVVSPGVIKTPLMLEFIANMARSSNMTEEEAFGRMMEKVGVPIGRMGESEEVAGLVAYLVSSEARYVTGGNYSIDGGALPVV